MLWYLLNEIYYDTMIFIKWEFTFIIKQHLTTSYRQSTDPLDRRKDVGANIPVGSNTRNLEALDHRDQVNTSVKDSEPRRVRDRSRTPATRRNGQQVNASPSPGPRDNSQRYQQSASLPSSQSYNHQPQPQHLDPQTAANSRRKGAADSRGLARNDSLSSDPSDCVRPPPPRHAPHSYPSHQGHAYHKNRTTNSSHVKKPCGPERRNYLKQHKSLSSSDDERYGTTPEYTSADEPESEKGFITICISLLVI